MPDSTLYEEMADFLAIRKKIERFESNVIGNSDYLILNAAYSNVFMVKPLGSSNC
jgi:hypothetical protein